MSRVIRSVKNVVKNRTIPEVKCIEATSNDPWFPSTIELDELAQHTFHPKSQHEIYQILYRRLNDQPKNWRHVLKSLIVFEFLIFHGHPDMYKLLTTTTAVMNSLTMFMFVDTEGKDKGNYIRERAKRMVKYIEEAQYYQLEKDKSLKMKQRVHGDTVLRQNTFSYDSDVPPQRPTAPDYAPKNREEEDLQLQLALAISKQEAQEMQTQSYHSGSADGSDSDRFDAFAPQQHKNTKSSADATTTTQSQLIDIFSDDTFTANTANVQRSASANVNYNAGSLYNNQPTQSPFYDANFPAQPQQHQKQPAAIFSPHPSSQHSHFDNNPSVDYFSPRQDAPVLTTTTANKAATGDQFDNFLNTESPFQSLHENLNHATQPPTSSSANPPQTETPLITSDAFRFVNETGLVDLSFNTMASERLSQQSEKKKFTLNEMAQNNSPNKNYNLSSGTSQFSTPANTPQFSQPVGLPGQSPTYMGFAQTQNPNYINNNPFASDPNSFSHRNSPRKPDHFASYGTTNNNPHGPPNPFDNHNPDNSRRQ